MWIPLFCLCHRVQRLCKNITVHLFTWFKYHSMLCLRVLYIQNRCTGVLSNKKQPLNVDQHKEPMQWPAEHVYET